MNKQRFEEDFNEYADKLKQTDLTPELISLMLHSYCMGYCDMINHVNEDMDSMYLIDPVIEKITELSPKIQGFFEP